MIDYTEDLIDYYFKNIVNNELISIEEARNVLIDKHNISKIKALMVIKTIAQSIFCCEESNTNYKISFHKEDSGKEFKFNVDDIEFTYTHLKILERAN